MLYYVKIYRAEKTIVVTTAQTKNSDYVTDSFSDAMQEARCYANGYAVFNEDMTIVVKIISCNNGK